MLKQIFGVLTLSLTTFSYAAELKPFDFKLPSIDLENEVCKFKGLKLPSDYVVLAAGAHGGYKTGFQIDDSGSEATQVDVAVNYPNTPVVLVLGAYNPTIWNIGWSQNTKIAAVYLNGYDNQVVAGLEKEVPVLISTYKNKRACGYLYLDQIQNQARFNELNKQVYLLFEKQINMIYPVYDGKVLVGIPLSSKTKLLTSTENTPTSFRDKSAPLAGKLGLDEAIKLGVLRMATNEDAQTWASKVLENSPPPDISSDSIIVPTNEVSQKISLKNAYVVIGKFIYPAGLFGSDAVNFLIPKGVPKPQGNPGHSKIVDFNSQQSSK